MAEIELHVVGLQQLVEYVEGHVEVVEALGEVLTFFPVDLEAVAVEDQDDVLHLKFLDHVDDIGVHLRFGGVFEVEDPADADGGDAVHGEGECLELAFDDVERLQLLFLAVGLDDFRCVKGHHFGAFLLEVFVASVLLRIGVADAAKSRVCTLPWLYQATVPFGHR